MAQPNQGEGKKIFGEIMISLAQMVLTIWDYKALDSLAHFNNTMCYHLKVLRELYIHSRLAFTI